MFVLPPAAPAADGDAAAQENEGVATAGKDGALGEHLPATGNAVGGNMATAAVDEDSHMGYTPEPGQAVAGAADVAAVSSMRWPKVSASFFQHLGYSADHNVQFLAKRNIKTIGLIRIRWRSELRTPDRVRRHKLDLDVASNVMWRSNELC